MVPFTAVLAAITALQSPTTMLSDLRVGDVLSGTVIHRHDRKLFLKVPVEHAREGSDATKAITAYTPSLPSSHELLVGDPVGQQLTVYVKKVQTASARLCVSTRDPSLPLLRAAAMEALPLQLERLVIGECIEGTVVSVKPFGVFIDCGVSRLAKRGRRMPLDAFLPKDQMDVTSAPPQLGQRLELSVLRPSVSRGRLLVSARMRDADAVVRAAAQRDAIDKRNRRRPGFASLEPGTEREGVVVKLEDFGAIINVGARKPGLVHISQLRQPGPQGGSFVAHPSEVCDVGDRVLVRVLPRTNSRRLALRLVRVFARDESELVEQRATLRRGQSLMPRFSRADDEGAQVSGQEAEEAPGSAEPPEGEAGPGALHALDETDVKEEEEEEDPWAWAAAGADDGSDEDGEEGGISDGPDFDEDYFTDKYDIDFY